jgi:hypothetical protein
MQLTILFPKFKTISIGQLLIVYLVSRTKSNEDFITVDRRFFFFKNQNLIVLCNVFNTEMSKVQNAQTVMLLRYNTDKHINGYGNRFIDFIQLNNIYTFQWITDLSVKIIFDNFTVKIIKIKYHTFQ